MGTAPLYSHLAKVPSGGCAAWITCADGVRVRVAHWPGSGKGTVLLFPGRTEYIEKYGPAAAEFNAMGYDCFIIDWRGQGLADRLLPRRLIGHVGEFQDYQHDVNAMVEFAEAVNMPKPFFMAAHSMGGAIGLRALLNGLPVQAAVFSGPMWGVQVDPMMRPFAKAITVATRPFSIRETIAPGYEEQSFVDNNPFEENELTGDRDMYDMMIDHVTKAPDVALGGPSIQWVDEAFQEMDDLHSQNSPKVRCATFLGTDETITSPERIKDRMARWSNGHLEIVEGGRHEVMMETPERRARFYATTKELFAA